MIVKILSKSKTFRAVRYNSNKVEKNTGELLKVSGFSALSGLSELKPQDYINYLSAIAALNKRVIYPQFHAVISAKGKSADKQSLVVLAENWLSGMGYGSQPYLLIFHKDTANNHIHIVSSRVSRNGEKIPDSFENIRAYRVLNQLIGQDQEKLANVAIADAFKYHFSTAAQFSMLLEARGYAVNSIGSDLMLSKFGQQVARINRSEVEANIASKNYSVQRKFQLKMIFEKYRLKSDARISPSKENLPGGANGKIRGYSSPLSDKLSADFGLEFIFHFKDESFPYGYTILDHVNKNVFKGGEIMALNKFVAPEKGLTITPGGAEIDPVSNESQYFPTEGLLLEVSDSVFTSLGNLDFAEDTELIDLSFDLDIADDIDDEQINGRNRRRQRKARTNTR